MVRSDKIKSALFGGVAFRNPTDTGYNIVNTINSTSTSGLYFGDGMNFVTIRNIKDSQEDAEITPTEFNSLLTNLHNQVIDDVCRAIVGDKSRMLVSFNLYPYKKKFDQTLDTLTGFVGFEIKPEYKDGFVAKIEWVEISLDEAATFNIHLFNSNLKAPIKTQQVITVANESTIIYLNDWFIADDAAYKGGVFYLGYYESDLGTAKPIKRDYENSALQVRNDFFKIEPLRLQLNGTLLVIDNEEYLPDTNGLNIGINIYIDFTNLIINNKNIFYPAIQYGMAIKVLDIIRTSIRSNITTRLSKMNVQDVEFELYGNQELRIVGIIGKYHQRLDAIKKVLFYEPDMVIGTLK